MGWASGSLLLGDIILSTKKAIPKKYRKEYYKLLITHFEYHDCDNVGECVGFLDDEYNKAYYELYPKEEE
jgi:hypothetical protein